MKKNTLPRLFLVFCLLYFFSCNPKQSAYEAGLARAKNLLEFFPREVRAVFFIDFHRAITTDFADSMLNKDKHHERYQEFIEETGIDPKEDIFFIAGAITEKTFKGKQKGFGIINLKYDKQNLLARIREGKAEIAEKEHSGVTVYLTKDGSNVKAGAFLDDSNIVIGDENSVKNVINTYQKKSENIFKNEEFSDLIKSSRTRAIIWGATLFPSDITSRFSDKHEMLKNLGILEAVTFFFDYKNENISTEIRVLTSDKEINQQIVDILQGIKAFGSLYLTEKPLFEDLLSRIEITSGLDYVQVYSKIPKELLEKINESKGEWSWKK